MKTLCTRSCSTPDTTTVSRTLSRISLRPPMYNLVLCYRRSSKWCVSHVTVPVCGAVLVSTCVTMIMSIGKGLYFSSKPSCYGMALVIFNRERNMYKLTNCLRGLHVWSQHASETISMRHFAHSNSSPSHWSKFRPVVWHSFLDAVAASRRLCSLTEYWSQIIVRWKRTT